MIDYPLQAIELFSPREAAHIGPQARVVSLRQEQLKERLGERFRKLDVPLMVPVGIFVFARLGLYRAIVRFMGGQAFMAIVKGSVFLALLLWSVAFLARFTGFPRSIPIIFGLVLFTLVGGSRILVRGFYQWLTRHYTNKEPVAICGAGSAGAQLASALQKGGSSFLWPF